LTAAEDSKKVRWRHRGLRDDAAIQHTLTGMSHPHDCTESSLAWAGSKTIHDSEVPEMIVTSCLRTNAHSQCR
jgi:hypothetical protein